LSKKLTKEEVRGPDMFISSSDKALEFIERHSRAVVSIFVVGVVLGLAYVIMSYVDQRRESSAAESIYSAEAELQKARGKEEGISKFIPEAVSNEDYQKRFAGPVANIEAAIESHADTRASLVAALNLSFFLVQQKQYAEALKALEKTKFQPKSSDLMAGFWNMHRGLVYLENKDTAKAQAAYEAVLHSDGLKVFHSEAMLKLGYCKELSGQKDQARELYEKVSREFPRTEAAQSAQQYLRVMQLQSTPQQG
jgi:TolA-binding protein